MTRSRSFPIPKNLCRSVCIFVFISMPEELCWIVSETKLWNLIKQIFDIACSVCYHFLWFMGCRSTYSIWHYCTFRCNLICKNCQFSSGHPIIPFCLKRYVIFDVNVIVYKLLQTHFFNLLNKMQYLIINIYQ